MKTSLFILVCVAVVVLAGGYVPGTSTFIQNVLDRTPPEISEPLLSQGEFSVTVSDQGSNLRSILVIATQGAKTHQFFTETPAPETKSREITFPVDFQALGFKEGEVSLKVSSDDRSFYSNYNSREKLFSLDLSRPKLEILSLQHIAHQAGAELVIFRASDPNLVATGIELGERIFRAFPVSYISSAIKDENTYAALFALPYDFDPLKSKPILFAKDSAGNKTTQSLSFRLGTFKQADVQPKLTAAFLENKIPELYQKFLKVSPDSKALKLESQAELIQAFKFVNEDYRRLLDTELGTLLSAAPTPRKGSGAFMKPMSSATSSNLGEKRSYMIDGKAVSFSVHNGLDLASVQNDTVYAAQDGEVILAKDFGIYGDAVVIDHGLGVSTLYGHLASISVRLGDVVTKGAAIGQSGQTGLAGGDHLHFEIRVAGAPVNPIEWWDSKWIEDNIDGKVMELSANTP